MIALKTIRILVVISFVYFLLGCVMELVASRLTYSWGYPLAVAGMLPLLFGFLGTMLFGLIYLLESAGGSHRGEKS